MKRYWLPILAILFAVFLVEPATAQQITERTSGSDVTYLSEEPHRIAEADGMIVRSIYRERNGIPQWVLAFQGTLGEDDVTIRMGDEIIDVLRISADRNAPGGRTTIFFEEADFNVIGRRGAEVRIGDTSFELPDEVVEEMRRIYRMARG